MCSIPGINVLDLNKEEYKKLKEFHGISKLWAKHCMVAQQLPIRKAIRESRESILKLAKKLEICS